MRALWSRAASGETQVLLVSGEAGIGKTRLVHELALLAEASGASVLIGRCAAEGDVPYAPIAQIIRLAFDRRDQARGTLPAYILADLLALAPQLRPRYPDVPSNPRLAPAFERQRVFDSFVTWCELLAHQAPVLLVVEDVHWADSGTLSLLHHLARRTGDARLLLAMTYRDTEVELVEDRGLQGVLLDLNRERLATALKLGRLNREQTRDLATMLLAPDRAIRPEVLDSIYRETEGNPFFVEEVCKALIEEGQLDEADGAGRRFGSGTVCH